MLLYAIYTPDEPSSLNPERLFAFASVERFVAGMRLVNESGKFKGALRPITYDEAMKAGTFATLFNGSDKPSEFDKGTLIYIGANGVRDNWDGKWREVHLVEKIENERVPGGTIYA